MRQHEQNISCIVCEDIREEKSGGFTFVGVFPDNLFIQPAEGSPSDKAARPFLPRLFVYMRINFGLTDDIPLYHARIVLPDEQVIFFGILNEELIKSAKEDAKKVGLPLAGITIRAGFANVVIRKPGLMRVEVTDNGRSETVGAINLNFDTEASSATASPPPS